MADFVTGQAAGGQNVFSQIPEAINQGMNWAHQRAQVDLQQKALQDQMQLHKSMEDEAYSKIEEQTTQKIHRYFQEPADSPIKGVLGTNLKNYLNNSKYKSPEEVDKIIALGKDSETSDQMADKFQKGMESITGMKASDPQGAKAFWADQFRNRGGEVTTAYGDEFMQKAMGAMMTKNLKEAQLEQGRERLDLAKTQNKFNQEKTGQGQYEKIVTGQNGIEPMLNGAARATSLIDKIEDPNTPEPLRLKSNRQLRTILSNEDARLVTGKANFGEGTAAGMATDSYAIEAKDLYGKVLKNGLVDTLTPDNIQQAKILYGDLKKEYMKAHDRAVDRLTAAGSGPQAELDAISARAKGFRATWAKENGSWDGPSQEGVPNDLPKKTSPSPSSSGPAAEYFKLWKEAKTTEAKQKIMQSVHKPGRFTDAELKQAGF